MLSAEKPPLTGVYIAHFGIKGMKWGVRKKASGGPPPTLNTAPKGVTVRADGSISIKPGASLQRLTRSNGKSMPMQGMTYASMLEYDNARYIKVIGGKGILGGGRDQVLSIKATKKIEAPSKEEAVRMVSDLLVNDAKFREKNTGFFGEPITDKELKRIKENPTGKDAEAWYDLTNTKMTFDAKADPNAPHVQKVFKDTLAAKGYNAVRDENDVGGKVSKAPIIIFDPEKSLKVVSVTQITDELRAANKETLGHYKSMGKDWLDKELYG